VWPESVDCGPVTDPASCAVAVEAALGETGYSRSQVVAAVIEPRAQFRGCPGNVACVEPTVITLIGSDGEELETIVLKESPLGVWGPYPRLFEEDLADVSFESERPTAVCGQDPSDAYAGGPRSQIYCHDGLALGFRALRTQMPAIERLYLQHGACTAVPCTQAELDTVAVIGWLGNVAYSVGITSDPYRISVPIPGATADWPAASSSVAPPLARPSIDGASRAIRTREPYPYCGRTTRNPFLGTSKERPSDAETVWAINRCFFDGVLDGRPVEMIEITAVTRQPVLLRFDGDGFITRYIRTDGVGLWRREEFVVVLNASVFNGLE
jgi:hypothetical protein